MRMKREIVCRTCGEALVSLTLNAGGGDDETEIDLAVDLLNRLSICEDCQDNESDPED